MMRLVITDYEALVLEIPYMSLRRFGQMQKSLLQEQTYDQTIYQEE